MRQRRIAFATVAEAPISGINTTPLIDVLLVLLIMFILTIPIASHSVKITLPGPGNPPTDKPIVHRLAILPSGALAWDGDGDGRRRPPRPPRRLPRRRARWRPGDAGGRRYAL